MAFWKGVKPKLEPGKIIPADPNEVNLVSDKPKWKTGEGYDIVGQSHKEHVQKKLDDAGITDYHIEVCKPNELQIDYDSPELPTQFSEAMELLVKAYAINNRDVIPYRVTRSKSDSRHVIITLPKDIDAATRIAWQSIFGSDFRREGLSMMSVVRGIADPTLLLERNEGALISTGIAMPRTPEEPEGRKFR